LVLQTIQRMLEHRHLMYLSKDYEIYKNIKKRRSFSGDLVRLR